MSNQDLNQKFNEIQQQFYASQPSFMMLMHGASKVSEIQTVMNNLLSYSQQLSTANLESNTRIKVYEQLLAEKDQQLVMAQQQIYSFVSGQGIIPAAHVINYQLDSQYYAHQDIQSLQQCVEIIRNKICEVQSENELRLENMVSQQQATINQLQQQQKVAQILTQQKTTQKQQEGPKNLLSKSQQEEMKQSLKEIMEMAKQNIDEEQIILETKQFMPKKKLLVVPEQNTQQNDNMSLIEVQTLIKTQIEKEQQKIDQKKVSESSNKEFTQALKDIYKQTNKAEISEEKMMKELQNVKSVNFWKQVGEKVNISGKEARERFVQLKK
ncbi:Hypothetical_protein [Hexamita inflata]|uniref:Hypothetical_protein n=1 Tax=Hexamita inflata TaxID=28002 RepID=A0AA86N4J5_9EUKA|nr:Hypothetical protein HINF_LOCUS567 [Hexamita inflata]